MQTRAAISNNKPYSDELLAKVGAQVMRVYHKINGTPEVKMKGAKDIVFAMLNSSHKDLQKSSAVDQVVYRSVAEQLLKQAGGSGTYPNVPPGKPSTLPGEPGIGNKAIEDRPQQISQMDQAGCESALEKSGIDDPDFRQQTCAAYLKQQGDSVNPDPNQKGAHRSASYNSNSIPTWLLMHDRYFSGGPISRPSINTKAARNASLKKPTSGMQAITAWRKGGA